MIPLAVRAPLTSQFLTNAAECGLVVAADPALPLAVVERQRCACGVRSGLAVFDRRVIVSSDEHLVPGCAAYDISSLSPAEHVTIVSWLQQYLFYMFGKALEPVDSTSDDPAEKKKTLKRFLLPSRSFRKVTSSDCATCMAHELVGDPIFFLQRIVLCGDNKGPNLESVLL